MNIWTKILISILRSLPYGQLTLTTYEKDKHTFIGNKNGPNANVRITNESTTKKIILEGSIGFGEEYISGNIKTSNLQNLLHYFALNNDKIEGQIKYKFLFKFKNYLNHYFNKNLKKGSKKNITFHYDLGNDFYKLWLDKSMTYSSAVFQNKRTNLREAQKNKYKKLFNLLEIRNNDDILEIGSGWGGFIQYVIQNSNCKITSTTISDSQFRYNQSKFKNHYNVKCLNYDYRDLKGKFDKIVSIEMFEAVGKNYWDIYFKKLKSLLNPEGIISLQIITIKDEAFNYYLNNPDFIQKYIFPGGMLPTIKKLNEITLANNLKILESNSYSLDYAKTLFEWRKNFNKSFQEIKKMGFDEKFKRLWNFYLTYCESGFKTKRIDLKQIKISHN